MKKKEKQLELTCNHALILKFLWKWKMANTAMIANGVFPQRYYNSVVKEIGKLLAHKFIEARYFYGSKGSVYSLTQKGFENMWSSIEYELADRGFKSEFPNHDFAVTGIHLGEFGNYITDGLVELYSEQELRRVQPGAGPEYLPQCTVHRPDGFIYYTKENYLVALEVEINGKSKLRYDGAATFYDIAKEINLVLWIIESEGAAKRILKRMEELYAKDLEKQNFVLLSDYTENFWDAKVSIGSEAGKSIHEILGRTELKPESERKDWKNILLPPLRKLPSAQYKRKAIGHKSAEPICAPELEEIKHYEVTYD